MANLRQKDIPHDPSPPSLEKKAFSDPNDIRVVPPSGLLTLESPLPPNSSRHFQDSYAKIHLISKGQVRWKTDSQCYLLGADYICHIPVGLSHCQETLPSMPAVLLSVYYDPAIFSSAVMGEHSPPGLLFVNVAASHLNQAIRAVFQEMLFEQEARQEGWEMVLHSSLLNLMAKILRLARRRTRNEPSEVEKANESGERVARYALRLKSQFFQQQSIEDASRSVGLGRRQFTEVFRRVIGQNWRQYVLGLRLKHAAGLLVETNRPAVAVAFDSGFEDLSHFHHCFKSAYGCSPLIYRKQRQVQLPQKERAFPEPLRPDSPNPGFRFRGTKGWAWTPEQYLEEIPVLAGYKMNFLMNCYLSLFTRTQADEWKNEWWKPLPAAKEAAYLKMFEACRKHSITFCFAMHPQLFSPRPLNPANPRDIDQLYDQYGWAQSHGVKWFSVCLDCFGWGNGSPSAGGMEHASLVNSIFNRLRKKDPEAQMILGPGLNWGEGANAEQRAYLEGIAGELHPEAYVFWGGDGVITSRTSRLAAESYRDVVKHKLFLWDNYPVNDGYPTMHLGPLTGRDPGLCEVIEGYMSNPMARQNQINRLPLATCADYAYNPKAYNPVRSIGQAILRWGKTKAQQKALKDLVEAYPGYLVAGGGARANPARVKLQQLLKESHHQPAAHHVLHHLKDIMDRMHQEFPNLFDDAKKTLLDDVAWMREQLGITE